MDGQPSASRRETVFMFSGQGSQYFQMGRHLFDGNATFRDWMIRLDATARQLLRRSVIETLYADGHRRGDVFDRTLLTHPAIFMVEYSLAQCLMRENIRPDMVLGVSAGSFAAAAVAGLIDVDDAMTAVIRQAMALEECSEAGGMTAVLTDPSLFAENFLCSCSELAAVNFASHFVVSATPEALAGIETALSAHSVGYQRLPVSFPFHSRWIDGARRPFVSFMRSLRCTPGTLPLVCCDRNETLSGLPEEYFWDVVRHPIRFRDTVARLEQEGAHRYIDLGPSGTLATFLKYGTFAAAGSTVHAILTPFGGDDKNLKAVLARSDDR